MIDAMFIDDLLLEALRAIVLVILVSTLLLRGRSISLSKHPGWNLILIGFCLITFASVLDLTDEIPGLERFLIIGDTRYEALLEKLPGYLLGFILVLIGFYRMIPSLRQAEENEQALLESEERFRHIFVANPDPVILARFEDGAIIDVNPAFTEQSGYERETVIGRNSAELDLWVRPGAREAFREQLRREGSVDNLETEFRIRGGLVRAGLLSARTVTVAAESCLLIVVRDISRIKEAERALREVDRIRSEFISTAAHELRTPLSVLIGYAELLSTPESRNLFSEDKKLEFLEQIQQKGQVLSQIIDDLLDISRMDAGLGLDLNYDVVAPDKLLRSVLQQFQLHAPKHHFCLDLDGKNDVRIECDEKRINQALENLLSNAVKYSREESHITLSGRARSDAYEFSVTDQGCGMTPEQVARIFEKFYRVDTSNTAVGGLGLGMSIVKQIVDAHQGTIDIESTPGEGTRIGIVIPRQKP